MSWPPIRTPTATRRALLPRKVAPYVDNDQVRWVGNVVGIDRDNLVARARATLYPVCWDEPGGTTVIESLALSTPVVG